MIQREKFIVHVDMDAFFASVEQRDNPAYRGKPVIVGADPKAGKGRGVVSACSYEARRFGIHSAMPISIAYKKCPDATFLKVDMERYARVSDTVFDILERFTPEIEPISIDEAFLDISGSYQLFGTLRETCQKIKETINAETGLTSSIGLASNKMTAKIASELSKPDGLLIVEKKNLLKFLHPLPINKLCGVGEKTREACGKIGIKTIGDLAGRDPEELAGFFGENGRHAWELANGIDPREVETEEIVKSVSNERTFSEDTRDKDLIKNTLMYLSEKVSRRLRKSGLKCRTVTLKIRFKDFSTFTRSVTLKQPTNFVISLYENCLYNVESFNLKKKAIRLLGVRSSNLVDNAWQSDLFDESSNGTEKKEKIHKALDRIKDRFGEESIKYRG